MAVQFKVQKVKLLENRLLAESQMTVPELYRTLDLQILVADSCMRMCPHEITTRPSLHQPRPPPNKVILG